MKSFLKPVIVVALVVAVPVLPFLFLGEKFEDRVSTWVRDEVPVEHRVAIVIGVLATDIFLPVPSSAVSTWAGGVLGFGPALVSSWIGMTVGSVVGFGLARLFGSRFALLFAQDTDLEALRGTTQKYGPVTLLVTRPLPILAEATVLLMGASRLSWRRFIWPVVSGNLLVSAVYSVCGVISEEYDSLLPAAIVSGMLPLGVALFARQLLWNRAEIAAPEGVTEDRTS